MQNRVFWTRITSLYGSPTSPVILCMQTSVISIRNTSLCGSQPSSAVFVCKAATFGPELQVSMGPRPHLWLCACIRTRLTSLYWSQTSSAVLSTHNCVLRKGIKIQYWFQPSPVGLCMQNSGFRTRITSLCGSKILHVVFAYKTATSGPERQVSMGPRHDLSFRACTTVCLASELLVSMSPNRHLWFLHSKQRLLDQNYKSLWVPDMTCHFVHAKQCD